MKNKIKLLCGTANRQLAEEVSVYLKLPITPVEIKHFNDGEAYVRILESVRGCHVFIIQPTSPNVNEHLMELLLMIDAARRASAKEITVVISYYGYARQDRKALPREPISAKLVANLISVAGADRVVTFDLHVNQIQGFFNIPVDNLEFAPLLADYLLNKKLREMVVVSPDAGGAKRARKLADLIDAPLAIIDKRRPKHGESEIMNVIGDIKGKSTIILDDMIDTAGTITNAAKALIEQGAKEVYVCATHPVFSGHAIERLERSPAKEVIVSNTVPISSEKKIKKIKVISVAKILAEAIKRIYMGEPMGVIFDKIHDALAKRAKYAHSSK